MSNPNSKPPKAPVSVALISFELLHSLFLFTHLIEGASLA